MSEAVKQAAYETMLQKGREGRFGANALVEWAWDILLNTGVPAVLALGEDDLDGVMKLVREACEEAAPKVAVELESLLEAVGRPSDCERLEAAFASLENGGIVGRHTLGWTWRDGLDLMLHEVVPELRARGVDVHGYVFCNEQTVENAVHYDQLTLGFGSVDGDPSRSAAVGQAVVAALREAGLEPKWDGTRAGMIELATFRWLRQMPADPDTGMDSLA